MTEKNEIVIVGRSNVGKSSLIRSLTGIKVRVGRKPGVTLSRRSVDYKGGFALVDLPGFGFMRGVKPGDQEKIKGFILKYLEERESIALGIEVVNSTSFLDIAQRWDNRGQIPFEIELFQFLNELKLNPIVVANKIDKIPKKDRDEVLGGICHGLGLTDSWQDWKEIIVPFSAKTGEGKLELERLILRRVGLLG